METHIHYRGKPIKMAKCGKYSYARCMGNCKRPEECATCTLIKRHPTDLYKWIGTTKLKKCSKCGVYYPIKTGFYKAVNRPTYLSWCKFCKSKYQLELKNKNNETKSRRITN